MQGIHSQVHLLAGGVQRVQCPVGAFQRSDVLPPYDVLDNILEDYVEDYRNAEQIAADRGYDLSLVRNIIRMIEGSEYKRQQAAPGLKITPKAFGLGRRFPIAQKSEV